MSGPRAIDGRRRGFTLVELIVAITIFTVILAAVARLLVSTQRAYVQQREASMVLAPLRRADGVLSRLLQTAGANPGRIAAVATGRLLPGIYALASPAGGIRLVADYNPADGSLDGEFEDVQTWVANDTLWVSWRNQGGTAAPAQPVAAPVTSVTYSVQDATGAAQTLSTTTKVSAARVLILITAPQRIGTTTTSVRRETWVVLRNR